MNHNAITFLHGFHSSRIRILVLRLKKPGTARVDAARRAEHMEEGYHKNFRFGKNVMRFLVFCDAGFLYSCTSLGFGFSFPGRPKA